MVYCSPKKHKDVQVYNKINNNSIPEVQEKQKRIKQDYESVKNQVMESNSKVVDIPSTKTQTKQIIKHSII